MLVLLQQPNVQEPVRRDRAKKEKQGVLRPGRHSREVGKPWFRTVGGEITVKRGTKKTGGRSKGKGCTKKKKKKDFFLKKKKKKGCKNYDCTYFIKPGIPSSHAAANRTPELPYHIPNFVARGDRRAFYPLPTTSESVEVLRAGR